jgi:hypothetical protein
MKSLEFRVPNSKVRTKNHTGFFWRITEYGLRKRFLLAACCLVVFTLHPSLFTHHLLFAEEYKFDASEVEKKPYNIGGYVEFNPILFGLDKSAALYKLRFFDKEVGGTTREYDANLQLEGSFERGISRIYAKTHTGYTNNYAEKTTQTKLFEGYLSVKPSHSFIMDFGKKTLNWGKGYAWNPAAFLDRPKNPDDPELSREGYIVASADFTKSFQGALKTFSFTPVFVPVYTDVNDDLGEVDRLNFASKFYFLLYDMDLDLLFQTGGSRTTRYGMDFSRNIGTNLEVHGEFSWINNFQQTSIDEFGNKSEKTFDAKNYLIGIRYLTEQDTTYILEYYRNGAGFSSKEMRDYFAFVDKAYDLYLSKHQTGPLSKAIQLFKGPYGKMNPSQNYLYAKISQKDPFDILYYTPAITLISNVDDKSFSVTPEITYTGITNLELRLRTGIIVGSKGTEYGEKPNDYKVDIRLRYYF